MRSPGCFPNSRPPWLKRTVPARPPRGNRPRRLCSWCWIPTTAPRALCRGTRRPPSGSVADHRAPDPEGEQRAGPGAGHAGGGGIARFPRENFRRPSRVACGDGLDRR
jgi:hypothetical protein